MQQVASEIQTRFDELIKPILEKIKLLKERDQQNEEQIKNLFDQMSELKQLIGNLKPLKIEEDKKIVQQEIKKENHQKRESLKKWYFEINKFSQYVQMQKRLSVHLLLQQQKIQFLQKLRILNLLMFQNLQVKVQQLKRRQHLQRMKKTQISKRDQSKQNQIIIKTIITIIKTKICSLNIITIIISQRNLRNLTITNQMIDKFIKRGKNCQKIANQIKNYYKQLKNKIKKILKKQIIKYHKNKTQNRLILKLLIKKQKIKKIVKKGKQSEVTQHKNEQQAVEQIQQLQQNQNKTQNNCEQKQQQQQQQVVETLTDVPELQNNGTQEAPINQEIQVQEQVTQNQYEINNFQPEKLENQETQVV
ncbi:unnamed protein product [Paramecium sonneborni]|uniref:Uncharacterized protein n=1 Tax=Paramecium sonneborni TaxID=65129 RepID=A0A8S1KY37_9CILI|nr:unnamed protein product [Paramecium sonneborni]